MSILSNSRFWTKYSGIIGLAILLLNYVFNFDVWAPRNDGLFLLFLFVSAVLFTVALILNIRDAKSANGKVLTIGMKLLSSLNAVLIGIGGLLLIMGIIVLLFSNQGTPDSSKDAMINDLNNIAAQAYQYRIRPAHMDGGGGSYIGYTIHPKISTNANGFYTCQVTDSTVTIKGLSANNKANSMTVQIDSEGRFVRSSWTYTGDFQ